MSSSEHLDLHDLVAAVDKLDDRDLRGVGRWLFGLSRRLTEVNERQSALWQSLGCLLLDEHDRRQAVLAALDDDAEDGNSGQLLGPSEDRGCWLPPHERGPDEAA